MTDKNFKTAVDCNNTSSNKIKAVYPHIVVGGKPEEPYFSIHWYDVDQKEMICGFSSYDINFVLQWLEEEFEVVDDDIDNMIKAMQALIDLQRAEIDRLRNAIVSECMLTSCPSKKELRIEAIKEFSDKLKAEYKGIDESFHQIYFSSLAAALDNLVKEMTNDIESNGELNE